MRCYLNTGFANCLLPGGIIQKGEEGGGVLTIKGSAEL